jgi:hypothetical protein
MFRAAFRSAFSAWPHWKHSNNAWVFRFSSAMRPQQLHCCEVNAGGTATSVAPRQAAKQYIEQQARPL